MIFVLFLFSCVKGKGVPIVAGHAPAIFPEKRDAIPFYIPNNQYLKFKYLL